MEKTPRQNRIREVLGKLYDQHPPHFRETLRRFQEDPTSRVFAPLAEAYRRMGQVEEAITICNTGLAHHPDFHGGRVALAKCYIDKKDFEKANVQLAVVVAQAPENLLAQRLLGDCCLVLGQKKEALHAYKMALLLAPSDVALNEKIHRLENEAEEAGVETADTEEKTLAVIPETTDDEVVEVKGIPQPLEQTAEVEAVEEQIEEFVVPVGVSVSEDEPPSDPHIVSEINSLLGVKDHESEDDSFKIEHVSRIFNLNEKDSRQEITTETLGDLYFSQEQFQKSLEIFEKLYSVKPSLLLDKKIQMCRSRMGVDPMALTRAKKIEILRSLLKRTQDWKETATL